MTPLPTLAAGPPPTPLSAGTSLGKPVTFAHLGQGTRTLGGYSPSVDVYLPVPGGFTVGNHSHLAVIFSQSALLDPRTSTIQVSVNGADVAGELLNFKAGDRETLNVTVPRSDLKSQGDNHISVLFSLNARSAVAQCGAASPDVTVTLYGSSWFQYDLHASNRSFAPALATLPSPFASPSSPISAPITVSLPARPSGAELTAAGRVLARFGEDLPTNPPKVVSVDAAHLDHAAPASNLLIIGTPRDNPSLPATSALPVSRRNGTWVDAGGQAIAPTEGIIYETPNPYDRRYAALVITANGPTGIVRASTILSSQTLRQLLHGTYALVPSEPLIPPQTTASGHTVALGALGFGPITVEGFGERDATVSFELSQRTAQNGTFTLIFSHGQVAQDGMSSVRVDLNGQPVASRVLHANDPAKITWQVSLPADGLQAGQNTIAIRFFFLLPQGCSVPPDASSWALIDNTSTLYLPSSGVGGTADLSLLPFPLVKDGSPNDLLIVVPDDVMRQYDALQVAELVGTQCHVDAPLLSVTPAAEADTAALNSHVVLVDGTAGDNPVLRQMDVHLPVRLAGGLRVSASSPSLKASLQENADLGIIEEIPAPWGPTKTAVVVSASASGLLPLTGRQLFSGLSGNVATVTAGGAVSSFSTAAPTAFTLSRKATTRPIGLFTGTGVVSILILAVASLLRRRRPGGA